MLDDEVSVFYQALNEFLHSNADTDSRSTLMIAFERVRGVLSSLQIVGQVLHHPHAFMTKSQWKYYESLSDVNRHRLNKVLSKINPTNEKLLIGILQANGFPVDLNEDSSLYIALCDVVSKIHTSLSKFLIVSMKKVIASFSSLGQSPITQSIVERDESLSTEVEIYDSIDDRVAKSIIAIINGQHTSEDAHVALTIQNFISLELLKDVIKATNFKELKKKIQAIPDVLKQYRNTTLASIEAGKKLSFERIHSVTCQTLLGELRDLVASTMFDEALIATTYRGILVRKILAFSH